MNLNRWFVVLASTIVLGACSDSVAPTEPDTLDAQWAGASWVGSASATLIRGGAQGDTLLFYSNGPTPPSPWWYGGYKWGPDAIVALVAFHGTGTYILGPGAAEYWRSTSVDTSDKLYSTTAQASGTLVITKYGGVGKTMEGSISFDAVASHPSKPFGENASLKDGQFRAIVHDSHDD